MSCVNISPQTVFLSQPREWNSNSNRLCYRMADLPDVLPHLDAWSGKIWDIRQHKLLWTVQIIFWWKHRPKRTLIEEMIPVEVSHQINPTDFCQTCKTPVIHGSSLRLSHGSVMVLMDQTYLGSGYDLTVITYTQACGTYRNTRRKTQNTKIDGTTK